jgi:hypothetical protein
VSKWGVAILILVIVLCTFAQGVQTGSPITGSQVITLEAGPDGVWLGQAYAFGLRLRADTHVNLIYDTWRLDGVTAYRQWDLSISKEWTPTRWMPLSATLGTRWRPPLDDVHSYGGSGPWAYLTIQTYF